MAIIKPTKPYTFTNGTGQTADATEVNENFDTLFSKGDEVIDNINNAAGSKTSLKARIDVALNADGTLKTAGTAGIYWVNPDLSPTYVSATQFTVSGDQTDIYLANRRLKIVVAAGTYHTYVTASSYSAGTGLTTVTVVSGLTNPITSVEHSVVIPGSGTNLPPVISANVTGNLTGNVTGAVTGNVTGDVTGNLTGNADTATTATNGTLKGAMARASGAIGLASGGGADLDFTSEDYDTDSLHDNSTNPERFTIPAGWAYVDIVLFVNVASTGANLTGTLGMTVYKNGSLTSVGSTEVPAQDTGSTNMSACLTLLGVPCAEADYFKATIRNHLGQTINLYSTQTYMVVRRAG